MLNQIELERLMKFRDKHTKCSTKIKVTIFATDIGDGLVVKCCGCKKKKDITDYDSW
jgi:hypothetical protein